LYGCCKQDTGARDVRGHDEIPIIGGWYKLRQEDRQENPMARDFEDHCWKDIVDEDVLKIYEPYRREVRVGPNPAVLVIDLYNKAYQGGSRPVAEVNHRYPGSCGENAWQAIEPTRLLLAAARAAEVPVIYTTRHTDTGGVRSTHRRIGTEAEEIYHIKEELAPLPGDRVIYKERASGFFGTPLIAQLRQLGVDSLIILGESTSGCVRASTVDAYSYGFHSVVVEECTFDRSLLSHKINLFDLHHKYGDVMHVDEVIAHLAGLARGRDAA
jgi:maleamate amidohydrolase